MFNFSSVHSLKLQCEIHVAALVHGCTIRVIMCVHMHACCLVLKVG